MKEERAKLEIAQQQLESFEQRDKEPSVNGTIIGHNDEKITNDLTRAEW